MFTTASLKSAARSLLAERVACWAAAGSVVVVVLGGLASAVLPTESPLAVFLHLDREHGLAAGWSALLLLSAAVTAFAARRVSRWFSVLGAFLALFAVDEFLTLHETLEDRSTVDWQLLYAPLAVVVLLVAVALLRVLRARHPHVLPIFVAGGACWVFSQALEAVQWDGDVKRSGYVVFMHVEEALEMSGTVLLLGALLVLLRRAARPVQEVPREPRLALVRD